ncbi:MAG: ArsJ-associated glyceraldehyde-3-phosphate dehydrogenase [Pseudomonadales bacterium]|nr:ArsJ-associated glyceraldehyde-3-phosphate dehydrogenase [Pseudomonadales bacterium]
MSIRIGINGFGRMGRLALRAAWDWPELDIVHINELAGDVATAAHLLEFDSVHGRWPRQIGSDGEEALLIEGQRIGWSRHASIDETPWAAQDVDIVVECTGRFRTMVALAPYFDRHGLAKVVVSAPVKSPQALNVVMGVNHQRYQPERHHVVTAASCTTNCLAPVVDVVQREFGIRHGVITTIHDVTNTQSVLDSFHKDLRRARAASLSLIPSTTGSASAIADIFPELKGKLNGLAVRVPLANASLTDCVFELSRAVTVAEVNAAFADAAAGRLAGILGYEERPLVSVDYTNDPRSSIIDALSTMVIDGTQLKVLAWYDNELAYVMRLMELTKLLASQLPR